MRRLTVIVVVAGLLAAGCAREPGASAPPASAPPASAPPASASPASAPPASASPASASPASASPASAPPAVAKEAEVYVQVLRRYLGTPSDNSFPGRTFATVYVLDQAYPDAGDPNGTPERGTPIGPETQREITAALAQVVFIADRKTVIEERNGCAQVRDGGILITLGPADGDDHEVKVAVNGFVACLGATWLTYVVRNQPGSGWRVTGTTGSMAVA